MNDTSAQIVRAVRAELSEHPYRTLAVAAGRRAGARYAARSLAAAAAVRARRDDARVDGHRAASERARGAQLAVMELSPSFGKPRATRTSRTAAISFGVLFALAITLLGAVIWPFRVPLFFAFVLATRPRRRLRWTVRAARAGVASSARSRRRSACSSSSSGRSPRSSASSPAGSPRVSASCATSSASTPSTSCATARSRRTARSSRHERCACCTYRASSSRSSAAASPRWPTIRCSVSCRARRRRCSTRRSCSSRSTSSSLEGPRLRVWLERISPLQPRQTRDLFAEFRSVARASIFGTTLAALFQAVAATLGYIVDRRAASDLLRRADAGRVVHPGDRDDAGLGAGGGPVVDLRPARDGDRLARLVRRDRHRRRASRKAVRHARDSPLARRDSRRARLPVAARRHRDVRAHRRRSRPARWSRSFSRWCASTSATSANRPSRTVVSSGAANRSSARATRRRGVRENDTGGVDRSVSE